MYTIFTCFFYYVRNVVHMDNEYTAGYRRYAGLRGCVCIHTIIVSIRNKYKLIIDNSNLYYDTNY